MAGAGFDGPHGTTSRPVVVTGADGFVGHALCVHLAAVGRPFRAIVRAPGHERPWRVPPVALGDLATVGDGELENALAGAAAVVHLAGRAHVMRERASDPRMLYRAANVHATERVVRAAQRVGVTRFVLASSVKVCGERTRRGHAFEPGSRLRPRGPYARSKAEAERVVLRACEGTSLAPLLLRLPLVYGPRVGANFARMMDVIARERWLPLGAVQNRRSLIYVGNLVEAIEATLSTPEPVTGAHFVADANAVSTTELLRAIGTAVGTPARLGSVPAWLVRAAGTLVGRGAVVSRLLDDLEVDSTSFRVATRWKPRYSLEDGLDATAAWWRTRHSI